MHMYARCDDYSDFVAKQLENIAKSRKPGAEIIVLGKAANAEKLLNGSISNITFLGDHFTEKLGKKFDMDIKEEYFVYDDHEKHLAIWPVDGCLNKCKFCRRSYMEIKFESLSLETIRTNLDLIRLDTPELMRKISKLLKNAKQKSKVKRSNLTLCWCRWPESNRHGLFNRRILSPVRLPVPPHLHFVTDIDNYTMLFFYCQ